jgi:hypothetical protein
MPKFPIEKISDKQRYEKSIDFAKNISDIDGFYIVDSIDLYSHQIIRLYVEYLEEVTKIYILTKACSNWFLANLPPDLKKEEGKIIIPFEYMRNFDLVRVIPANGYKYVDSYLRIMKKIDWKNYYKSIEDEIL